MIKFFIKEKIKSKKEIKGLKSNKKLIPPVFFIFILTLLLFLFQSRIVCAVGFAIAPAFKNTDFVPYLNDSFNIRVYNNLDTTLNISVSMTGDLKEFAILEKKELSIKPFSYETVSIKISLPEKIDFGEHLLRVMFSSKELSGTIGGALTLNFDYKVFFKEEELLNQELFFENNEIVLKLNNEGKKELNGFSEFYFYDSEKQISFLNKTFSLKPGETTVLKERISFSRGEYFVVAKTYSPKLNEIKNNFTIGNPEIIVDNIILGNETGSIKSLSFDFILNWNKPLQVFAEVFLINNSMIVGSFKSNSMQLNPNKTENLKMFLDLSGFENEKYLNFKLVVNFQGKLFEKNINIIKNKKGAYEVRNMNIYYLLIILLVLINLFLLIKLILFSKNKIRKIEFLIIKTEKLIENNDFDEAKKTYHKIKEIYDNVLNEKEKKQVYEKVMKVYHKLSMPSHHKKN